MKSHGGPARAFTMVEVLIAMALVALLMSAAALAIQAAGSAHAYNAEKTDLLARQRGVLDRISRHVRLAISFEVPDSDTVAITMPDGIIHTYAWNRTTDELVYSKTDGEVTVSSVLTDRIDEFVVSDDSPACSARIALKGTLAASEGSLTATPRKLIY